MGEGTTGVWLPVVEALTRGGTGSDTDRDAVGVTGSGVLKPCVTVTGGAVTVGDVGIAGGESTMLGLVAGV